MMLHFRQRSEAKGLPDEVGRHLRWCFMLPRESIEELRCFETEGVFRDQPVKRFSVFSAVLARKLHLDIRTIADLDEHSEVLVFEGRVSEDGSVYFADRRRIVA